MEDSNKNKNEGLFGKIRDVLGLYGLVYIFFLIALIVVGTVYLSKIGYLTSSSLVPVVVSDTTSKLEDIQMKRGGVSPPVDVMLFLNPTDEILTKGKQLYETQCASCHGADGFGDGVAGATLDPAPRNMHDLNGWINGPGIDEMYMTLQDGIKNTGMASFSNLSPEDRLSIISYIRTFTPDYPEVTQSDLEILDITYRLADGVTIPNQIPVSLAMQKLIEEYKPTEEKVSVVTEKIKSDNSQPAVDFKKFTNDIPRVLRSFLSNRKWIESQTEFINFIVTDPVQKGFNAEITDLNNDQWQQLYSYISGLLRSDVTRQIMNNNTNNTTDTLNAVQ